MNGFVEMNGLTTDELDDIEMLTADRTVGRLWSTENEWLRGYVLFDLYRLRRALLAYEAEFDESDVEIGIVEVEDTGPLLVLVPDEGSHKAIVLAPRMQDRGGIASEGLVEVDDDE